MAEQEQVKQKNLTPAEVRAVLDHKYYLGIVSAQEVSFEDAYDDFLKRYDEDWRREKLRRDNTAQINEINKFKYLESKKACCDIGSNVAGTSWCAKYARIWREENESLTPNGFIQATAQIRNANGLHLRPTSALALLAGQYECNVYLHNHKGMDHYNFIMNGKPYINVKSFLTVMKLGIICGDTVELISTGAQAREALDAILDLIRSGDTD